MTTALLILGACVVIAFLIAFNVVTYLWARSGRESREAVTVAQAEVAEKIRDAEVVLEQKLVEAKADRVTLKAIKKIKDARKQRDEMAAFSNRHRGASS